MKVLSAAQEENRRSLFRARARKQERRRRRVLREYSAVIRETDEQFIEVEAWFGDNAAPYNFHLQRIHITGDRDLRTGDHVRMRHVPGTGYPIEFVREEIDVAAYAKKRADELLQGEP